MFTGIVQHLGEVAAVVPREFGVSLTIDSHRWSHAPGVGDSVAVNGCCLTLAGSDRIQGLTTRSAGDTARNTTAGDLLCFDVIHQTLALTTLGGLHAGDLVNLEPAATPTTLLGGHIVQGHVDGVGRVISAVGGAEESRLRIEPPAKLMDYIFERGSVAVDGVSLTVAGVDESWFEVALIPTTLKLTNLGRAAAGWRVNIETDYLARAVISWLQRQQAAILR